MEVASGRRNLAIILMYECLCAMMLLYTICMTAGSYVGKFGVIFTVMGLVLISAPITGAHFNPAITLSVYISNKDWRKEWDLFIYVSLAAFVGAWWGCSLAWIALYNPDAEPTSKAGIPLSEVVVLQPGVGLSLGNAFFIEALTTFVFVYSVLLVKTSTLSPSDSAILTAFGCCQTLLAMVILDGASSGAALNPAIGFSLTIYDYVNFGDTLTTGKNLAVYVIGPYVGGAFAGLFHKGHLNAFKKM